MSPDPRSHNYTVGGLPPNTELRDHIVAAVNAHHGESEYHGCQNGKVDACCGDVIVDAYDTWVSNCIAKYQTDTRH